MGIFDKNTNVPAFYYVYGNKTYYDEIKAYLFEHFQNVIDLNLSSSTGCGFKFISYDIGEVRTLDGILENYEGWIQTTRRNEFNDLETDLLDLDKYLAGCNQRITGTELDSDVFELPKINWYINAHKNIVAIRNLNYSNTSGSNGNVTTTFGSDIITNGIVNNTTVDNNKIIRKNLNGDTFNIKTTNCDLNGYVVEYKGSEYRNFKQESTSCTIKEGSSLAKALDKDVNTRCPYSLNGGYGGGGVDSLVLATNEGDLHYEVPITGKKLNIQFAPYSYVGDATQDLDISIALQKRTGSSFTVPVTVYDTILDCIDTLYPSHWLNIDIPEGLEFNRISFYLWGKDSGGSTTPANNIWFTIWEMFVS